MSTTKHRRNWRTPFRCLSTRWLCTALDANTCRERHLTIVCICTQVHQQTIWNVLWPDSRAKILELETDGHDPECPEKRKLQKTLTLTDKYQISRLFDETNDVHKTQTELADTFQVPMYPLILHHIRWKYMSWTTSYDCVHLQHRYLKPPSRLYCVLTVGPKPLKWRLIQNQDSLSSLIGW